MMNAFGRRAAMAAIVSTLLALSAGGGSTRAQTTPPVTPATSCSIPLETQSLRPRTASSPKPASTENRTTRRGRVYEELWKHEAAVPRLRPATARLTPNVSAQDFGEVAVIRDEGDIIQPPNPFDLRSTAVLFSRNGSGGYDIQHSGRGFAWLMNRIDVHWRASHP